MFQPNHITQAQVEALFDDELAVEEQLYLEEHMDECRACSSVIEQFMEEQSVLTLALQEELQQVTENIDWNAFSHKMSAQIALTSFSEMEKPVVESIVEPINCPAATSNNPTQTLTTSWFHQTLDWLRGHPGFLLASAATAGILFVLALPMLDPGPSDAKDVVVERIIKAKTAKVSVLSSKNKATGQSIIIIDVKEPPTSDGTNTSDPNKLSTPHMRNRKP